MLLFFHVTDESRLTGLQTGLFYPDNTPKPSLDPVSAGAADAERGELTCPPGSSGPAGTVLDRRLASGAKPEAAGRSG